MRATPLRMARTTQGLTQADIGKAIDVDPATISRIEGGQVRETAAIIQTRIRIAEFLGVKLETIFPPEK